jgi:hypothetical protein
MSLVTFNRIGPTKTPALDVRDLATAMHDEPLVWFAVRSVSGGDREGIKAVVAALNTALDASVKLWEARGRGFYAVSLEGTGSPYENEPA